MRSLSVLALSCAAIATINAQSDPGTVSDPAGAVVANASVEAKNTTTGAVYQGGSSTTGNYTLAQLPVGTYEISVTAAGF
ncbi:MAG: carboxypeptidase regulatory-like domain-containing protein [Acidobacteriia bacterium]|nr:carboxypeptidase regulatory-like domain-containing protein [Terriglobia bacterium]